MAVIVIITGTFPYPGGEQFFESEVTYWGALSDRVVVVPTIADGVPRAVPGDVEVDLTLARLSTSYRKVICLLLAPFSRLFFTDVRYLASSRKVHLKALYHTLRAVARCSIAVRGLSEICANRGTIDLVYSYWNGTEAYAAAILKRRGLVRRVVSRAHGGDIIEERSSSGHLPLKRQFIADFDRFFPNSRYTQQYLETTYRVPSQRNVLSMLGVQVPVAVGAPSGSADCSIVSVSFCVPVKRIERIVGALAIAARIRPDVSFRWTHVGGGPLLPELMALSKSTFRDVSNVDAEFAGKMSNREVFELLLSRPVDMFISASESEGLGVAIMEAMSCGIPIIAPNVGGIPELVGADRGVLLEANPPIDEIGARIADFINVAKRPVVRRAARQFALANCDAQSIYPEFVLRCTRLAR